MGVDMYTCACGGGGVGGTVGEESSCECGWMWV